MMDIGQMLKKIFMQLNWYIRVVSKVTDCLDDWTNLKSLKSQSIAQLQIINGNHIKNDETYWMTFELWISIRYEFHMI